MKISVVVFLFVVSVVCAEVPRFGDRVFARPNFNRNQATFRASQRLRVPARQEEPKPVYGPPAANQPSQGYYPNSDAGASQFPQPDYLPPSDSDVGPVEAETEPEAEQINLSERLRSAVGQSYFIYHPNGALERVTYSPRSNLQTVAISAPLRAGNAKIIREPIFTYDANTFAVQRLQ